MDNTKSVTIYVYKEPKLEWGWRWELGWSNEVGSTWDSIVGQTKLRY